MTKYKISSLNIGSLGTILGFAIPIILIVIFFASFDSDNIKLGLGGPEIECIYHEIVTSSHPNSNTEIIYREPTKICSVSKITSNGFLFAYQYSYDFMKKYNKSDTYIVPKCNEEKISAIVSQAGFSYTLYNDLAVFDNHTMNYVCPDGSQAMELSRFEAEQQMGFN